jgi:hypothetical protein
MNKQQIKMIERVLESEQSQFALNQGWRELHEQYNIGWLRTKYIDLTADDKRQLAELVHAKTALDLSQVKLDDLKPLHREQALALVTDEKMAGQSVKQNRLALKSLPGYRLKLNQQHYHLPDFGYLDMGLDDIACCQHQTILVVENYRCFDQLQKHQFKAIVGQYDPLVIYRGDKVFSEKTVRQLLQRLDLPVLVMADLDPKGLLIAQSFPNLIGLVAPELAELEALFKQQNVINPDLYTKQHAGSQKRLASTSHLLIQQIWKLIKNAQAGITQEHWLEKQLELSVLAING